MLVGYVRVSTVEQSEERQIVELRDKTGVEKFFVDKVSAKSAKRPKFDEMMNFLREGDELIVSEFSRLARSTTDLLNIVETLTKKDVKVRSLKEQLDSSTPQGKFMLTIFGAIAEFERELLLQRQREGIKLAKAAGKYKGRNEKKRPKDFDYYKQCYYERTMTVTSIAKHYKVSRPTVYKWLRQ
jgi:DNA invertase Pin-like site-specific DNA recombinase